MGAHVVMQRQFVEMQRQYPMTWALVVFNLVFLLAAAAVLLVQVRERERERECVCVCVCVCALAPIHAHLALLHSLSNRRVGRRGRHAAAHAHGMALQPLSDRARGARLQTPASVPVLTPNARASAAVRLEKDICGMFHGAGGAPRQAWVMVSEGVWCLKVYDIISGPDRWQGSGFSPAAGGENFWAFFSPSKHTICVCIYTYIHIYTHI